MDINIISIISSAYAAFLQSAFFFYLKIFSAIVSFLLFIDIILLFSKRIRTDLRMVIYGSPVMRFKKSVYNVRWQATKGRLEEGSVASSKIALIEADKMLNEALGKLGYIGKDTEEKISHIGRGQLVAVDELKQVAELHRTILDDPTHETSLEELRSALGVYERVFKGIELID